MGGAGDDSAVRLQSKGRGRCTLQVTAGYSIALHEGALMHLKREHTAWTLDGSRGLDISMQCLQVTEPEMSCRAGLVQAQRERSRRLPLGLAAGQKQRMMCMQLTVGLGVHCVRTGLLAFPK